MFQNSIRHNLSLHNKFVRVQNEGTGKSSWWIINPDAKTGGKSSRRRASNTEPGDWLIDFLKFDIFSKLYLYKQQSFSATYVYPPNNGQNFGLLKLVRNQEKNIFYKLFF